LQRLEETTLKLDWSRGENGAKNGFEGQSGGSRGKHKYLAVGCRSDFHLEAHQVLRLVDILTFTVLKT
jgi:hypothetical protein